MNSVFRSNLFAMVLMIIWILGNIFLSLIFSIFYKNIPIPYFSILANILFLFLPVVFYFLLTKQPIKSTLKLNGLSFLNIILIIGFAIFIQPFMMFLSALSNLFFTNTIDDVLQQSLNIPTIILLSIFAATPALFEELTMRGVVLSGYKNIDIKIAAIINGLLFGMLHLNFQQFFYAFILGIFFVYLVEATGSIFSSMIAHFIINSSQILLLKLYAFNLPMPIMQNLTLFEKFVPLFVSLFLALIFTPAAIYFLYLIIVKNNKLHLLNFKKHVKTNYIKHTFWPIYVSAGVFLIFSISSEIISKLIH